jgi:hypothetical protein
MTLQPVLYHAPQIGITRSVLLLSDLIQTLDQIMRNCFGPFVHLFICSFVHLFIGLTSVRGASPVRRTFVYRHRSDPQFGRLCHRPKFGSKTARRLT